MLPSLAREVYVQACGAEKQVGPERKRISRRDTEAELECLIDGCANAREPHQEGQASDDLVPVEA